MRQRRVSFESAPRTGLFFENCLVHGVKDARARRRLCGTAVGRRGSLGVRVPARAGCEMLQRSENARAPA